MVAKKRSRTVRNVTSKGGLLAETLMGAETAYNPVVEKTKWQDDVTEVLSGKAVIFKTPNSGGRYYVRMWLPAEKKYLRKSLKTKSKAEAISKAEQEVINTLSMVNSGYRIFSVTFDEMVTQYLANQRRRVVKLHLKLTHYLHLILTHLVRSSITHLVGFLPVISSR